MPLNAWRRFCNKQTTRELVSGFVSFVEGQLTLEPRVMMTKPAHGRWTQKLRLWLRYLLPAFCLCRLPLISC
ncbi:hypothetical protein DMI65_11570 [Escherichia coli]|nr:hypothetical protein [Escherichia coli]